MSGSLRMRSTSRSFWSSQGGRVITLVRLDRQRRSSLDRVGKLRKLVFLWLHVVDIATLQQHSVCRIYHRVYIWFDKKYIRLHLNSCLSTDKAFEIRIQQSLAVGTVSYFSSLMFSLVCLMYF